MDCSVCTHERRREIEAAAEAPGADLFQVIDQFPKGDGGRLKRATLAKHMASHPRADHTGTSPAAVDGQRAPRPAARSGAKTLERQRAP